jgi:hypothetical protein
MSAYLYVIREFSFSSHVLPRLPSRTPTTQPCTALVVGTWSVRHRLTSQGVSGVGASSVCPSPAALHTGSSDAMDMASKEAALRRGHKHNLVTRTPRSGCSSSVSDPP